MKKDISLDGIFVKINKDDYVRKKLGKKIKGRKTIPNYYVLNTRVIKSLPIKYFENDYNQEYIKQLKDVIYTCKEFECGNISDSSEIMILSVDKDFPLKEYSLRGIFDKKNGYKIQFNNK